VIRKPLRALQLRALANGLPERRGWAMADEGTLGEGQLDLYLPGSEFLERLLMAV